MAPPATIQVTGTLLDATDKPVDGTITFQPATGLFDALGSPVTCLITDVAGSVVITMAGVVIDTEGGQFTASLVPTDTAGLSPSGWLYNVSFEIPGVPDSSFLCHIPSSPNPVDLSQLIPAASVATLASYLPTTGGTMSGLLILASGLRIPAGAAAGLVWTSDANGNGSWLPPPQDKTFTLPFTDLATVAVPHGLGKYPAVTVTDTAYDVVIGEVTYNDINNLTVAFSAPFSGVVVCN